MNYRRGVFKKSNIKKTCWQGGEIEILFLNIERTRKNYINLKSNKIALLRTESHYFLMNR